MLNTKLTADRSFLCLLDGKPEAQSTDSDGTKNAIEVKCFRAEKGCHR